MESIESELFGIKHKTQAINSKVKGNRGELEATKLLSAWTGKKLKRVSWFVEMRGDVISDDESFKFVFSVEVKFYKNLGLKHSDPYIRKNSAVYKFMAQCQRDAAAAGKHPFLMIRENGMPKDLYYIFLPINYAQHNALLQHICSRYLGRDNAIIGFRSDTFFKHISYETLKLIYHGN